MACIHDMLTWRLSPRTINNMGEKYGVILPPRQENELTIELYRSCVILLTDFWEWGLRDHAPSAPLFTSLLIVRDFRTFWRVRKSPILLHCTSWESAACLYSTMIINYRHCRSTLEDNRQQYTCEIASTRT